MYGKFFSSCFTGSMLGAGAHVFAVWGYVIANTVNSKVELNPKMLSFSIGCTEDQVKSSIDYLCQPDTSSRNKDRDGCRLIRDGEYQYHVVSHAIYRKLKNEDDLREYNRIKKQESRAKIKKNKESNEKSIIGHQVSPMSPYTEAEAEADIEQKQKPSRRKAPRGEEIKHSSDPRHVACKDAIFEYYRKKNGGEDPDWDGREGKALGMLLGANPKLTADGLKRLLAHRAASEVNHSDRPGMWLGGLKSFLGGPIDRFGKPLKNGGKNGNGTIANNRQALAEYIAELEDHDGSAGGELFPLRECGQELSETFHGTTIEGEH